MILVDSQDASPIYEQVYRRIRTLIMTEALKEGEQLPSVRSLPWSYRSIQIQFREHTVC